MGLDMYLRARKYVSGYGFQRRENDPEVNQFDRLVELFGVKDFIIEDSPSAYVEFTIGYWRKANHIHEWFVKNVQNGVDECQPAHVSREKLKELRETCLRVLAASHVHAGAIADPSTADELLPTAEGFFFGSQEYSEWYLEDVKDTVKAIDRAFALDDGGYWSFVYQSSW